MEFRRIRSVFMLLAVGAAVCPALVRAQQPSTSFSNSAPELDQLLAAKESGLLTDWRIAGPFGHLPDLKRSWDPEHDQLRKLHYGDDRVVNLQFANGKFELPAKFPRNGIFYAASDIWIPNSGEWRVYAETAGSMIVFVDGKRLIQRSVQKNDLQTTSEVLHLEHGDHRILVKFIASAAPFHLAVMPQTGGLRKRNNKPNIHETAESQYTSAELRWPETN
jgi:hypothetical protein